jgi:hypothetical protein
MSDVEHPFDPIKAFQAANSNPDLEAMLKIALGSNAFTELLKAGASETLGALVIGRLVTHRGIEFGELTAGDRAIQLYLIPAFLTDDSGTPVKLNGNEAIAEITALNGGIQFGDGYEKAITNAVARGEFKDGALILASQSDLLKLAKEYNSNPALNEMKKKISNLSPHDSWCVTSTRGKGPDSDSSPVIHVRLKGGDNVSSSDTALGGDACRSLVVVLRGKVPHLHS